MRWEGRELHHICSIVGSLTISKYSILYRLCPSSLFNTSAYDVSRQGLQKEGSQSHWKSFLWGKLYVRWRVIKDNSFRAWLDLHTYKLGKCCHWFWSDTAQDTY